MSALFASSLNLKAKEKKNANPSSFTFSQSIYSNMPTEDQHYGPERHHIAFHNSSLGTPQQTWKDNDVMVSPMQFSVLCSLILHIWRTVVRPQQRALLMQALEHMYH